MRGDDRVGTFARFRYGPWVWAVSALAGLLLGVILTGVIQPHYAEPALTEPIAPALPSPTEPAPEHDETAHGPTPTINPLLVIPFGLLLASIALMPFISHRIWHRHFPDFAFFLGGITAGYYLKGFGLPGFSHGMSYGQYQLLHAGLEYYSFIALVGGLYVVSGGLLIELHGKGRPLVNTLILAFGAVLANLVGTTGASVLLVRPFMRLNHGRLCPLHVVMFIFIVSNCGGCLTPIGDPPLYLGYIKGVPFSWTLTHLWNDWLLTVGILLAVFFVIDSMLERRPRKEEGEPILHPRLLNDPTPLAGWFPKVQLTGTPTFFFLALMILGVFVDPILKAVAGIEGIPIGATFQVLVAASAYRLARKDVLAANDFTFFPVKEVGLLFVGIFITMIPALGYLSQNGAKLGLDSATAYYFGTGALSAVLDNAPTYMNFLQVALAGQEVNPASIRALITDPAGNELLKAISTGAVFFGAMTYIGNGPNFMVRSIAESAGVKMPSFFGYLGWACAILLPVLVVHWFILIR